jgi:hypothetical protein
VVQSLPTTTTNGVRCTGTVPATLQDAVLLGAIAILVVPLRERLAARQMQATVPRRKVKFRLATCMHWQVRCEEQSIENHNQSGATDAAGVYAIPSASCRLNNVLCICADACYQRVPGKVRLHATWLLPSKQLREFSHKFDASR